METLRGELFEMAGGETMNKVDLEERLRTEVLEEVLVARANGRDVPLDPKLFPPHVFGPDGERLIDSTGRPLMTDTELSSYVY